MLNLFTYFAKIIIDKEDLGNTPTGTFESGHLNSALNIVFSIAAAVSVLIIAVSALRIVISRGKSEDVSKARNAIIYAGIGLAITMAAFIIVQFVVGAL